MLSNQDVGNSCRRFLRQKDELTRQELISVYNYKWGHY